MSDKNNQFSTVKKGKNRFTVTYGLAGLAIILLILGRMTWSTYDERLIWERTFFSVLFAAFAASGFALLGESGKVKRLQKPWIVGVVSVFIAVILLWMNQTASDDKLISMLYGSILFVLFMVLSFCLRGDNERIGTIMLCYRLVFSIGLGIVLFICASAVCVFVIEELLKDTNNTTAYDILAVVCLFLVPLIVFHVQIPKNMERISGFSNMYSPLKLLFLPIWLIVVVSGYVHILLSMTRHAIAPAVSMNAATVGFLLYTLLCVCLLGDDSRIARIFVRFGWCLLIPVLIMYIIGVKIRFDHYGLTTGFFASMLIIGHCLVLIWMIQHGKALYRFFSVAAVSSIVFTFTPIGVYQLPMLEQQARMQKLLEENGLYQNGELTVNGVVDEDVLEKIFSCYDYLSEGYEENKTAFAAAALPKDDDEFVQMYGYIPNDANRWNIFNNYHSNIEKKGFSTEGYTYVVPAYGYENNSNQILIEFVDINGNERTVDLTEYALSLQSQHGRKCDECELCFAADENTLIVLEYISYRIFDGEISWYQCRGYALQR